MKKRKDCFFGLHFDFHAGENSGPIGEEFDGRVLDSLLREVRPDFVQCDSKGHPGHSSYPTKVGVHPPIAVDILRKWREITAKYDITLYAHHSGIWDMAAAKEHPEWAVVEENGEITDKMSVFGEYADKRLIPQLKELALDYGLNGAWLDGECWATQVDYGEKAVSAYREATGKEPAKIGQAGYREYQDFLRAAFYAYVKHYIDEVKRVAPGFEITSNWLSTSHAPDGIHITDYISGDLASTECVDFARFDGRVAADNRRPWDIMSWGFSFCGGQYVKPARQLCREAACVISLGGGFQVYHLQNDKRTLKYDWIVSALRETAEFCRAREAFCHKALPIPEAAILYSREALYDKFPYRQLFGPWGAYADGARGMVCAALENQISTELLLSHNVLERNLSDYGLLVVPDCSALEYAVRRKLLEYAENGGALLLAGADADELFAEELGISVLEKHSKIEAKDQTDAILEVRGGIFKQAYAVVSTKKGTRVRDTMEIARISDGPASGTADGGVVAGERNRAPALFVRKYGKGNITGIPFDFGSAYWYEKSAQLRDFFDRAVSVSGARLKLKVKISDSHCADIILTKKDGREYIHLVNTAGETRAERVKTCDDIPPLYNIKIEYKCGQKPKTVTLLPENKPLRFTYNEKAGKLKFTVKRIEIHSAVEVVQ
jgi:hypothetical protein